MFICECVYFLDGKWHAPVLNSMLECWNASMQHATSWCHIVRARARRATVHKTLRLVLLFFVFVCVSAQVKCVFIIFFCLSNSSIYSLLFSSPYHFEQMIVQDLWSAEHLLYTIIIFHYLRIRYRIALMICSLSFDFVSGTQIKMHFLDFQNVMKLLRRKGILIVFSSNLFPSNYSNTVACANGVYICYFLPLPLPITLSSFSL